MRRAIEVALLRRRGRLYEAACELGVSRVAPYRLMLAPGMREREPGGAAGLAAPAAG
ncbi:hypothetical protein [Burkholderia perseverans]|uniref:hypothetical protein n=1 Tax=Burkholderia perseverans TaxID=2615214 RepID=UPI003CC7E694